MVTDVTIIPVEPANEIVTLAQAKKHCKLEDDYTDEDDLVQSYIDAAVIASENFIGGHILEKDLTIKMDAFQNPLVFEAFPLQSVTSVKYFPQGSETEVTMPSTEYSLTKQNEKVYNLRFKNTLPAVDCRFDAVTVTVRIGLEEGKTPKPITQAILLQIGDMYERREDRTEVISTTAMSLMRPYKKY